jgi:hypothetical protein
VEWNLSRAAAKLQIDGGRHVAVLASSAITLCGRQVLLV